MKEQKFIITDNQSEIQDYMDSGWLIASVTAQNVSVTGNSYTTLRGKFAVVLEREVNNA
jgi:hypothetical protein